MGQLIVCEITPGCHSSIVEDKIAAWKTIPNCTGEIILMVGVQSNVVRGPLGRFTTQPLFKIYI